MKKPVLILFIIAASYCQAQFLDSLHSAFTSKKSLDFSYDSRNSFIDHNRVNVQSLKLGVDFGHKISIGGGLAWLQSPIYDTYKFNDAALKRDTSVKRQLFLNYFCYYIEYVYFQNKRWEFSIPMQFGVGKLGYTYMYKGQKQTVDQGFCFIYEPEVNVRFKIFRWIGVEADVGYRLLAKQDPFIKKTFNSPLFSFGAFILWDELALMVFKKNKWVQRKFGPSDWK